MVDGSPEELLDHELAADLIAGAVRVHLGLAVHPAAI
jgi:hypothetical protein